MSQNVEVAAQVTPNPNSLQFMVNRQMVENGSFNFTKKEDTKDSKLAAALFAFEGVAGVLIGTGFLTISKDEKAQWPPLVPQIVECIKKFLAGSEPAVEPGARKEALAEGSEIEQKIRQLLDDEIRPAVARDGGDIVFHSYEEGVVKLHLQGACSSCPSATMTLKMGIENRLKQVVPEIREVVQV